MRSAAATVAVGLALLAGASDAAAQDGTPVLGAPDFVNNGAGWGSAQPEVISNGGAPSGVVTGIRWRQWGAPVARGRGTTSLYRPQGGYFARGGRVALRATTIGTCPGEEEQPAYLALEVRTPQWPGGPLGPWFKWSGSRSLCEYGDTDPAYDYPRRPPGMCGTVGSDDYLPGTVFSIVSYRLRCKRARSAARAIGRRDWPIRCAKRGCSVRLQGLRCRLERVQANETTPSIDYAYPVQRVACRRGGAMFSAWLALAYD